MKYYPTLKLILRMIKLNKNLILNDEFLKKEIKKHKGIKNSILKDEINKKNQKIKK